MISLRKFLSLPPQPRLRKLQRLLHRWETAIHSGVNPPTPSLMADFIAAPGPEELPQEVQRTREKLLALLALKDSAPAPELLWELNALRHQIAAGLGQDVADWDLLPSPTGPEKSKPPLPCRVYVDGIRSPFNLGSIFRSSECFGVEEILIAPGGARTDHRRTKRSAMGTLDLVPYRYMEPEELEDCDGIFALETGGTPLEEFTFPSRGICIIGSEELGVRGSLRRLATSQGGIVSIPLRGTKGSLNVSVAFGILLHAWTGAILRKDF